MKRPCLADNVKAAAAAAAPPPLPRMPGPSNDAPVARGKRSATRERRKAVYAFMDPAEHRALKMLSLDTGRTIDALVTKAVQDLMAKHAWKE